MTTNKRLLDAEKVRVWMNANQNSKHFYVDMMDEIMSSRLDTQPAEVNAEGDEDEDITWADLLGWEQHSSETQPHANGGRLMPCPLCGGNVSYTENQVSGEQQIECEKCCFLSFWPVDWDKAKVLQAWNTRPTSQWIPVSEKLPEFVSKIPPNDDFAGLEESFDVWVYSEYSGLYGISRYVKYGNGKAHFRGMEMVSHWSLPLPPSPTQPEKENES